MAYYLNLHNGRLNTTLGLYSSTRNITNWVYLYTDILHIGVDVSRHIVKKHICSFWVMAFFLYTYCLGTFRHGIKVTMFERKNEKKTNKQTKTKTNKK